MKKVLKAGLGIVGLIILLSAVYWGIAILQKSRPANQPGVKSTGSKGSSNSITSIFSSKPERSISSKSVEITFESDSQKFKYSDIPLYKITKEAGEVIEVTADGNLAKTLIESLPKPSDSISPVPAKIVKIRKGKLEKLVRGEAGSKIDKEKTLMALEEAIKSSPKAASLSIPIKMMNFDGPESFEAKRKELGLTVLLAEFSTDHPGHRDDKGRNVNLKLAAQKIDGLILHPGAKFSFDKIVGKRSKKNGYQPAGVISRGRVIQGLGGGVCQVSTTLYKATLLSNMKIIERHNHSIYEGIDYADVGLDSAIAWGYKDFKFSNKLDTPVLISCQSGAGTVKVKIYANKKPFSKIELFTKNQKKHPFKTNVKRNRKLAKGQKKIVHPGVDGYSVETYRLVIENNGKKREERLSKDRYLTFNRVEEINN